MSCTECSHLQEGEFTCRELEEKWQELYDPTPITPGYRNKFARAAAKTGQPFDQVRLRFVYCAEGILNRFYLKRGEKEVNVTPDRLPCVYFHGRKSK